MRICIVTTDFQGFVKNGGVGTANSNLAKYLSTTHEVEVIFCHTPQIAHSIEFKTGVLKYKKDNIKVRDLHYPEYLIDVDHIYSYFSYLVYEELIETDYDKVIFAEMHGLGHYCMRAKKLNIGFQKTSLITFFHGPSKWHIEHNKGIPTTFSDLMTYYTEKMTCQLADRVLFATEHAKEIAYDMNYVSKGQAYNILPFPFDEPQAASRDESAKKRKNGLIQEICFFGRLESRKGIETFLEAAIITSKTQDLKITLLGTFGYIKSQFARDFLERWSKKYAVELNILPGKSKQEAIDYLKVPGRLAVICSEEETMGYTLIECITEKVPFICSDIKPFKEIVQYLRASNVLMFPSGNSAELLRFFMTMNKKKISPVVFDEKKLKQHSKEWLKVIEKDTAIMPSASPRVKKKQMISFCIVYNERPEFLSELMNSLARVENKEINIYVNNSKKMASKKLLEKISKLDSVKIYHQNNNVSPGKGRNFLAKKASHDLLFFIDDDNVLNDKVFNKIIKKMDMDWDIMTFPLAKFYDSKLTKRKDAEAISSIVDIIWLPIGDEVSFNYFTNRIGDGNFLVKRDYFIKLGGFNEELLYGEDQELFLRSSLSKGRYTLCPAPLIYYRIHKNNLSAKVDDGQKVLKLRQAIQAVFKTSFLSDFFTILHAWDYEKDRNTGRYLLDEINRYREKKISTNSPIEQFFKLQKLIKGKVAFAPDFGLIECSLLKYNKVQKKVDVKKKMLSSHFSLYATEKGTIYINNKKIDIPEGPCRLSVDYSPEDGITFMNKQFDGKLFIESFEN